MMDPCYYTSFLLGVTALYTQGSWMQPTFTMIMGTSILYHAKTHDEYPGKRWVSLVDRSLVHGSAVKSIVYAIQTPMHTGNLPLLGVYWAGFAWCWFVYYGKKLSKCKTYGKWWHATIHVVTSVGMMCLWKARSLSENI